MSAKRKRTLSYTAETVEYLTELVDELEPFGANNWAAGMQKLKAEAQRSHRPLCDIESLRSKFDGLAYTKKPTNGSCCFLSIRSAKHLAKAKLGRVNAVIVVADTDSNEDNKEERDFGSRSVYEI